MITRKIEFMLYLLKKPVEAITMIIADRPVAFSMVIFFLAGTGIAVSKAIFGQSGGGFFVFSWTSMLVIQLLFVLALTFCFHFTAELMNGRGSILSLFSLINFSMAPMLLLIPAALICRFLDADLCAFIRILMFLWAISFIFKSLKSLYSISTEKAVLVLVSPLVFSAVIVMVMAAMAVGGIVTLLL
jgi:hypothetical protein